MQGALNEFMNLLTQKNESVEAMMVAMREEMDKLKRELTTCMITIEGGVLAITPTHWVDVPKSKKFKGTRSTKEVDNFLCAWKDTFEHPISQNRKRGKGLSLKREKRGALFGGRLS